MTTVVFVHGTEVREPGFSKSFERTRRELLGRRPELAVEPCSWGAAEGARLWYGGGSVPGYDATKTIAPGPEDEELALWSLLYEDPFWELQTLAVARPGSGELPPGRLPLGDTLDACPQALDPSPELADALAEAGLAEPFESARAAVAAAAPYQQALTSSGDDLGVLRLAIARAIVAEALAEQAGADTSAVPDAGARDRIVVLLADALGGREYGIPDLVAAPIRGMALRMATARTRRRRGALTDAS